MIDNQTRFDRALVLLAEDEGGYVNHPNDPGGPTNRGVTQRTYDNYRMRMGQPKRSVRDITTAEVRRIYKRQYWDAVHADDLPYGVAYCVFDAAVNSGPGRAVRWLQKLVGARVDGIVGDETIRLTRSVDAVNLIERYCDNRLAFMKRLQHWNTFKRGWSARVEEVRKQSIEWARGEYITQTVAGVQPKAEGPEKIATSLKDALTDRGALSTAGGLLGGVGTLAAGDGPVPYAVAAVLVLVALTGVWWLVKGRHMA